MAQRDVPLVSDSLHDITGIPYSPKRGIAEKVVDFSHSSCATHCPHAVGAPRSISSGLPAMIKMLRRGDQRVFGPRRDRAGVRADNLADEVVAVARGERDVDPR